MPRIITYKCRQCGSSVVVTKEMGSNVSPIYCCGIEAAVIEFRPKKKSKKKPTVKKTVKKKHAAKKKTHKK
ncbi:MAG: hypothetical protein LLF28_06490 [Nitrospiraceae bacterium]|nr:hypothetical protein [Nitrospiraceae bacterium]